MFYLGCQICTLRWHMLLGILIYARIRKSHKAFAQQNRAVTHSRLHCSGQSCLHVVDDMHALLALVGVPPLIRALRQKTMRLQLEWSC